MADVSFDGMQVRRDIGWRAPGATLQSYAAAGVDIDEGNRAVAQLRAAVERTHGAEVVRGVGSFGGAFSAKALLGMDDPVLVASTDGVGTKVELAARLGQVRGVGMDIVNHCIGDILVQSARPLFFLDYIAASTLDADLVADIVGGMAAACEAAGCALLGGETAEMPGVYAPGAFDIAGTMVGVAERAGAPPPPRRPRRRRPDRPGVERAAHERLLAAAEALRLGADGRRAGRPRPPLGEALLAPHRSYLDVLTPALSTGQVKALAHITGGGLPENVPRVLPSGVDARIELGSWPVPPLFRLVARAGHRSRHPRAAPHAEHGHRHGRRLRCRHVDEVQAAIPEETWVIGALVPGTGSPVVHLIAP